MIVLTQDWWQVSFYLVLNKFTHVFEGGLTCVWADNPTSCQFLFSSVQRLSLVMTQLHFLFKRILHMYHWARDGFSDCNSLSSIFHEMQELQVSVFGFCRLNV